MYNMRRNDQATEDDYKAVPVEGFGMEMLRSFGYDVKEGPKKVLDNFILIK